MYHKENASHNQVMEPGTVTLGQEVDLVQVAATPAQQLKLLHQATAVTAAQQPKLLLQAMAVTVAQEVAVEQGVITQAQKPLHILHMPQFMTPMVPPMIMVLQQTMTMVLLHMVGVTKMQRTD